MVPVPYFPRAGDSGGKLTQLCPNCGETLSRSHRTLTCEGCGYVPKHGAD